MRVELASVVLVATHAVDGPATVPGVVEPAEPQPQLQASWNPAGLARLEHLLEADSTFLRGAFASPESKGEPSLSAWPKAVQPEGWTSVGRGISVWVEMVRPAEEIVQETLMQEHDLVRDPTLWSLAWAIDLDAQTALFTSISATRQLDEAVTDSMFDPDYAWFGLGILFRF